MTKNLLMIIYNIIFYFSTCEKLRFVFNVFRHGARAPYYLDKSNTDLFGNIWEQEAKITPVGMRQHYLNGIRIRQKYFSSLNITEFNYNPNEIAFFSTNTDRTIMSAYSMLFGMFPPGTGQTLIENDRFLEKISEPPIKDFDFTLIKKSLNSSALASKINTYPVKLFDKTANYFDLNDPANCPNVKAYQDENENGPDFQNFMSNFRKNYGEKILRILNKTNSPDFLNNGWNVYKIFDAYESNYFEGKGLKKFQDEGIDLVQFKNLTREFLYISDFIFNYGDKNSWVARLSFSPIFEYIIDLIDQRIFIDNKGVDIYDPQHPKMLFYSGHDTNLGGIQIFLKYAFGDKIVLRNNYFASVFNLELYQNGTLQNKNNKLRNSAKTEIEDNYYLKIYFNGIDIFGSPMSYYDFKNTIKRNLISREEIDAFCGFSYSLSKEKKIIFTSLICLLIIVIFILVFFIYKFSKNKITKINEREQINEYKKI